MDYQVELDVFRGPLDLLLYLVKRNEVDVLDIPIARITEQYLHYLELLQMIDVERAGDFLVLASTLMEIKSRLLLPRPPEADAADEDPRLQLVRQLIEYKKYREAAEELDERAERQATRLPRHVTERPQPGGDPAQSPIRPVEIWDLVSAFGRLLRQTQAAEARPIVVDETPIHVHMQRLLERLAAGHRARLDDLFEPPRTRARLIGLFMAVLELIKSKRVRAEQDEPFGDIWLVLLPPPPGAAAPEGPAATAPPGDS